MIVVSADASPSDIAPAPRAQAARSSRRASRSGFADPSPARAPRHHQRVFDISRAVASVENAARIRAVARPHHAVGGGRPHPRQPAARGRPRRGCSRRAACRAAIGDEISRATRLLGVASSCLRSCRARAAPRRRRTRRRARRALRRPRRRLLRDAVVDVADVGGGRAAAAVARHGSAASARRWRCGSRLRAAARHPRPAAGAQLAAGPAPPAPPLPPPPPPAPASDTQLMLVALLLLGAVLVSVATQCSQIARRLPLGACRTLADRGRARAAPFHRAADRGRGLANRFRACVDVCTPPDWRRPGAAFARADRPKPAALALSLSAERRASRRRATRRLHNVDLPKSPRLAPSDGLQRRAAQAPPPPLSAKHIPLEPPPAWRRRPTNRRRARAGGRTGGNFTGAGSQLGGRSTRRPRWRRRRRRPIRGGGAVCAPATRRRRGGGDTRLRRCEGGGVSGRRHVVGAIAWDVARAEMAPTGRSATSTRAIPSAGGAAELL